MPKLSEQWLIKSYRRHSQHKSNNKYKQVTALIYTHKIKFLLAAKLVSSITRKPINVLRVRVAYTQKVVTTHSVSFALRTQNAQEIMSYCKFIVAIGAPINPVLPSFNAFTLLNNVWEVRFVQMDTWEFYARNVITRTAMHVAVNNLLATSVKTASCFMLRL